MTIFLDYITSFRQLQNFSLVYYMEFQSYPLTFILPLKGGGNRWGYNLNA